MIYLQYYTISVGLKYKMIKPNWGQLKNYENYKNSMGVN